MIYLDTGIVVALCVAERDSDRVEAAVASLATPLLTSEWTRVEFCSALGIKVRTRELSDALARRVVVDYYQAFEPGLTVVIPQSEDYVLAAEYLQEFKSGLRSGDALHLAIAANRGATRMLTLDKALVKSARGIGISVALPW